MRRSRIHFLFFEGCHLQRGQTPRRAGLCLLELLDRRLDGGNDTLAFLAN
ncbi:hypothetical protein [Mesorhizobium sp. PAMC28654]